MLVALRRVEDDVRLEALPVAHRARGVGRDRNRRVVADPDRHVRLALAMARELARPDPLLELGDPAHQVLGRRRAAGDVDVDRYDLVDSLDDVIGAIEAAGAGTNP